MFEKVLEMENTLKLIKKMFIPSSNSLLKFTFTWIFSNKTGSTSNPSCGTLRLEMGEITRTEQAKVLEAHGKHSYS